MPASELRHSHQDILEDHHHYFSDLKMTKREISQATSLASAPNPNPKHASPPKGNLKNKVPYPKRLPGAKSSAHDTPGFTSTNLPEIRMPVKSAAEGAPRQFAKSPLASLLKKNQVKANEVSRLLVTVNVLGSAGPLRFLASCDDPVHKVIETALKSYAREGRLPILGQNTKQFELHCANSGCGQALDPFEIIGALGTRNFLLCKKHECKLQQEEEKVASTSHYHHQKINLWKNWLNTMSLGFGISYH